MVCFLITIFLEKIPYGFTVDTSSIFQTASSQHASKYVTVTDTIVYVFTVAVSEF